MMSEGCFGQFRISFAMQIAMFESRDVSMAHVLGVLS